MIRGAIYRVDLGDAKRGHEQRGRRYALVLSPADMSWSVATVIPASTAAQATVFRPEVEFGGRRTKLLVDQIRTIDAGFIHGEPVHYLGRDELTEVERAVTLYLGL
ncbi:type II toxin-antitoxin system PemK/MazF family toxin [Nonomuraea guangzhouensis]|uniref:Type II toxin-antitoxin system PemK/MazF family toxin n=1 Tax=Nonomuraea guangzhouensis TaxID=1291555 RepID=A0ABW4GCI7_9ACTN|nr:type II toxin-antitoxin system PemK/MazF family toxin [Nonomuraea guangzhouensis]